MEVHNIRIHVTHKKKWGEYLLEFFHVILRRVSWLYCRKIKRNQA
jgi:hypothetical protein